MKLAFSGKNASRSQTTIQTGGISARPLILLGLTALLVLPVKALNYPYAPYNQGKLDPQLTGWPLTEPERAYVSKTEFERRPGREINQHKPDMWPVTPAAGFWGGTSWLDTHANLVKTARASQGPIDVLLVGDSITMQWGPAWTKHFPTLKLKPLLEAFLAGKDVPQSTPRSYPASAPAHSPAAQPEFQSKYLAVRFSPIAPALSTLAVDSLGQGKLDHNPILAETNAVQGLELKDGFTYTLGGKPVWRAAVKAKTLTLRSDFIPGVEAPPLALKFDQKANHATLLGLMSPGERQVRLPCVLHLPDMGTLRITGQGALEYDARRFAKPSFVRIAFPPATAKQKQVEYRLEVVSIYPKLPGIEKDARYDGFRRDWLNIFQVNPRLQMLANNASSDPCSFTLFEYSDLARYTPPLAEGLTANDLVRMTLDRYLAGALGYGQIAYGCTPSEADVIAWKTPWTSLDTLPSFLISACNYTESSGDLKWARANYNKLAAWGREMMAADKDGNGLVEYPGTGNYGDRPLAGKRPANWWDCINFGHEDAFANALVYRACRMVSELAARLEQAEDARFFGKKADKLRAAYGPAFLNPQTGVLAGWKSADGQLHDYWFTYVQGMAVTFGLLDDQTANSVMDHLLAKMREVGYTRFDIGLPGNLVPVKKGDYVYHDTPPQVHGVPKLEDGSDGFQYYENGGATGCWSYYTVKALYQLGRVQEARQIFSPMLAGYARGEFQGFGQNGRSRDWRDWNGGCHGYEGLLVDNYHALLAVLDEVKAKR